MMARSGRSLAQVMGSRPDAIDSIDRAIGGAA
jgi:hypothetical protein